MRKGSERGLKVLEGIAWKDVLLYIGLLYRSLPCVVPAGGVAELMMGEWNCVLKRLALMMASPSLSP